MRTGEARLGANEPAIEARKTDRVENEEHPWLARYWVWVQNQKQTEEVTQLQPFLSIKGQDALLIIDLLCLCFGRHDVIASAVQ